MEILMEAYNWKFSIYNKNLWDNKGTEEYINSVTQVLKLHQGESIEQFKVGFHYPSRFDPQNKSIHSEKEWHLFVGAHIDGWIMFAMEKRVKVFELDLSLGGGSYEYEASYCIPHVQKLLSICGEVKLLNALATLKSFRFVNVRMTQEVVEFLLSHCPLLEQVFISASFSLESLKVAASVPKLRSMEISNCALKTVKVRAPALVSFTYFGAARRVHFKKFPLLSELTIGGDYAYSFIFKDLKHLSYCRNLKKLKLEVPFKVSMKCLGVPNGYPQLCNLKELELDINTKVGHELCFFTFLTECSPQLSRLTIRLCFSSGTGLPLEREKPPRGEKHNADCDAQEAAATYTMYHKCLEVVEFVGFVGCSTDFTIALHLLRIAPSLNKLILNSEGPSAAALIENKAIRKCAKKLKANLRPRAKLVTRGPGFRGRSHYLFSAVWG